MDSRDTRADIHGFKSPPWSINGPCMALYWTLFFSNFLQAWYTYSHFTFSRPFLGLITTYLISWYYNINQGSPLDPHGPQNGPCEADFKGTLVPKKPSWVPSRSELVNFF